MPKSPTIDPSTPSEHQSEHQPEHEPDHGPGHQFEHQAHDVLRTLRRCVSEIISSIGGVGRAVDLSEKLGLDATLGWKVWRIAHGNDTLPSAKHIPGRQAMQRFLDAARVAGTSEEAVERAMQAFMKFQRLARQHAGDRASADIILSSMTAEGRRRIDGELRRDAFRANTHFLGVRAACLYQGDIILPAPRGYMAEVVRLRGMMGLARTRAGSRWVLSRSTLVREDGPSVKLQRRPLEGPMAGPGLLTSFCSQPLPEISRRVVQGVTTEDELGPAEVGRSGAVDIVTGERIFDMPFHPAKEDAVTMSVNTPCESLYYDVMIHPAAVAGLPPRFAFHTLVHGGLAHQSILDRDIVPIPETLEYLGSARSAASVPAMPRYAAMLDWVFSKIGRDSDALELYRIHMKFPPLPGCLAVTYRCRGT